MIVLDERQVTQLGYGVIEYLRLHPGTSNLEVGEWITILAATIFMLGQESVELVSKEEINELG